MRRARRLLDISLAGPSVRLRTDAVEIRLIAVTADILRIRAGFDGDAFEEASYSLVTTAWPDAMDDLLGDERTRVEPSPLAIDDAAADPVVVRGQRLTVEIDRDPFRLRVLDADGSVLQEDVIERGWMEDANGRRVHTSRIARDDRFYGFGEKTGPLDKARERMVMRGQDTLAYDALRSDGLYKHIPFYVRLGARDRRAVGLFHHNTYACELDMGRSHSNYWPEHATYRTDGGDVDLFVIAGPSIREVVQRYALLTGTSAMLPAAALGYLGSSMYYPELPHGADRAILGFVDTARAEQIPLDGFQLSSGYCQAETPAGLKRCVFTWNEERFGDESAFFAAMTEAGVVVSPNVKPGVLTLHPEHDDFARAGMFVRDADEDRPADGLWWGGPGHLVDFTSKDARERWAQLLRERVLDHGTWSVWNDNCEYDSILDDDARCDGEGRGAPLAAMRSQMANLMCRLTVQAIEASHPGRRPFVVCRAGYAGIQRYAQTWSGDNATSWDTLRGNIPTMLGMSLSGVANQGSDIGGFAGPAPDEELLVRWVQHGVLQPRFSIHSVNSDNSVTEPWMYSGSVPLVRDAMRLRCALFPYLYSLMERAHRTGLPIIEPMVSAFQHDEAMDRDATAFMVGDALLSAPVLEPGATVRRVRLPEGETFFGFWDRSRHEGGQEVELPVDLASIPLLLRDGGIVPLATVPPERVGDVRIEELTLLCAPGRDGQTDVYEDDGASTAWRDGDWCRTLVTMRAGEQVRIALELDGERPTAVRTMHLDVVADAGSPFWVRVGDRELTHHLYAPTFAEADEGWYYDPTLRSVQVNYPHPGEDHEVTVSFEPFDMIGM